MGKFGDTYAKRMAPEGKGQDCSDASLCQGMPTIASKTARDHIFP